MSYPFSNEELYKMFRNQKKHINFVKFLLELDEKLAEENDETE